MPLSMWLLKKSKISKAIFISDFFNQTIHRVLYQSYLASIFLIKSLMFSHVECICKHLTFCKYNKKSNLSPSHVRISSISAIQILNLLAFVGIEGFIAIRDGLGLLSRLDPSLFLAMMLWLSAVVVIWVLFALTLPSLVRISSVLSQLLHPLQLFLLLSHLFLLFVLFLFFFFFSKVILLFLLNWSIHVAKELTILIQTSALFTFLLCDFLVESLPVLLDWVFCVLIYWDFDDSIIFSLFLRIMKILEVRMGQCLFNSDSVLWIEDKHPTKQIKSLLVHIGKEGRERSFFDKGDLIEALLGHHWLHWLDLLSSGLSQQL